MPTLRRSYKYPGLRSRAIDTGMYTVCRERDRAIFLVVCDDTQRIGGAKRWLALGTTLLRPLYAATKDDVMRWIAGERDRQQRREERASGARRSA